MGYEAMTGPVAVDQHGFTRNTSGTTDPAGSFATPRTAETGPSNLYRSQPVPAARTQPLPSEVWAGLSRDDWRARSKVVGVTMSAYKDRFDSTFKSLEDYELVHGTWMPQPAPEFSPDDAVALTGVPIGDFPNDPWQDEDEIKVSVVRRGSGDEPAVKITCAVSWMDRCDDDFCEHDSVSCPDTKLHALMERPGFITSVSLDHAPSYVLFEVADPAKKLAAERYFEHEQLALKAQWRNGIAESVAAGGLFWFR